MKERITGVDLCSYLLKLADENKYSLYLFGSTSDVIEKLVNVIKEKYSNINILGYSNGYEKDKYKQTPFHMHIYIMILILNSNHPSFTKVSISSIPGFVSKTAPSGDIKYNVGKNSTL